MSIVLRDGGGAIAFVVWKISSLVRVLGTSRTIGREQYFTVRALCPALKSWKVSKSEATLGKEVALSGISTLAPAIYVQWLVDSLSLVTR